MTPAWVIDVMNSALLLLKDCSGACRGSGVNFRSTLAGAGTGLTMLVCVGVP